MAIFALADLHLGFAVDKPMDIFGPRWKNHPEKIRRAWTETVGPDDTVLIPGDISWGMTIDEAMPDLQWIDVLPGRKILLKGNHDYWWSSIGRVRGALPPSLRAVQNDIDEADGVTIAGARGWDMPAAGWCEDLEKDRKIYERERGRLRRSLEQAPAGRPIVAMMHYPPFVPAVEEFGFHDILKAFGVHAVVFGHYHGPDGAKVFQGTRDGIRYVFCAADSRDFCPVRLSID